MQQNIFNKEPLMGSPDWGNLNIGDTKILGFTTG